MAMGKHGGRELNYASDIDVLFVYGDGDHHSYEAAARALMSAMNGPPTIFRTDADLRPQGRDGPLARSLEAFEAYYRRWSEVWELQALIKCRFAAGDAAVGDAFLRLVEPFVWPETLPDDAVEQIRALKARAEREVSRRGLVGREVKLAPGGIRDVEFAVQLLQLVHGRHHPELRSPTTLDALDVLGAEGFVAERDAAELAEAYVFLRHAEHRLQLARGRQTHTLPKSARERELLARGLGYRDDAQRPALDAFEEDWRRTTAVVRRIHERLFYRPLLESFGAAPAIGPTLPVEEARERLAALGFDRPPRAQEAIVRMTTGASRGSKIMRAILPGLLQWLSETPDPDAGLARLADLTQTLDGLPHLLSMLRDEPPVAELLCTALGTGPVLAELLARDPSLVAALEPHAEDPDRDGLVREATTIVGRGTEPVHGLRRFKDAWWLRLAAQDLAAGEDPRAFVTGARDLSHVADACLEAALVLARAEQDRRTLGPPPGGFAVIGMGRLGGRELSYASDLDVLFVYEAEGLCPDGSEGRLYHAAVAERVVDILGDTPPIFKVDTELRPEGRSGAVVRSLEAYHQYYERWADLWEFQALIRARHAAGDHELSGRFLDAVAPQVWRGEPSASELEEIRHIKARIERERVRGRQDRRFQVKLGVGGLADVEFTVQLQQMRYGRDRPDLRTPNTLEAIEALAAAEVISSTDEAWLRDAYLLLNRVRNHMFLLRGLATDALPTRDEELERLARSLGYGRRSRVRFLEHYKRVTRRARKVCDRLFYGED
jgi:glutamate-ammonia-ligase adenylyltransferase